MRRYFLIILLFIFSLPIMAENATNIRVRQEGKNIVITYDLEKKSVVRLLMAHGNSSTFNELKATSGDIGHGVSAGRGKRIVWRPLEEYDKFVVQNVRFKVESLSSYEYYSTNARVRTLIMGQGAYAFAPQISYGGMLAQMYKAGVGWYISGRSNYQFDINSDLSCYYGGLIGIDLPYYNGKSTSTHWMANVGLICDFLSAVSNNAFNTFGLYAGAGYGKRELYLETADQKWVKYLPTSYSGVTVDLGFFGSIGGFTLSAGVSTIKFKYLEMTVGAGLMF